jgi:hypothetical protein
MQAGSQINKESLRRLAKGVWTSRVGFRKIFLKKCVAISEDIGRRNIVQLLVLIRFVGY